VLLKIKTSLSFNLQLLISYLYLLSHNIFLDIYIRYGKLRVQKSSFITLTSKGNHDERSAEDADVKPPRVCPLSLEAFVFQIPIRLGKVGPCGPGREPLPRAEDSFFLTCEPVTGRARVLIYKQPTFHYSFLCLLAQFSAWQNSPIRDGTPGTVKSCGA
jgi:hypothetical protein